MLKGKEKDNLCLDTHVNGIYIYIYIYICIVNECDNHEQWIGKNEE
jgi:hypothetical protein